MSKIDAQYFEDGRIKTLPLSLPKEGYLSSEKKIAKYINGIAGFLKNHYKAYGVFTDIVSELIDSGALKDHICAHNKKTQHQIHLLPHYTCKEKKHYFRIYHSQKNSALIKLTIYKKENEYIIETYCSLSGKTGNRIITGNISNFPVISPISIANEVFKNLNTALDKIEATINYRKQLVASIRSYFEKGHYGFLHYIQTTQR